jgi:hypothetical protein
MNNYFLEIVTITIIDLNKRDNCKIKRYFYILGGIITFTTLREATLREIESAVSTEKN